MPGMFFGDREVRQIYFGDRPVTAVYFGDRLVWPVAGDAGLWWTEGQAATPAASWNGQEQNFTDLARDDDNTTGDRLNLGSAQTMTWWFSSNYKLPAGHHVRMAAIGFYGNASETSSGANSKAHNISGRLYRESTTTPGTPGSSIMSSTTKFQDRYANLAGFQQANFCTTSIPLYDPDYIDGEGWNNFFARVYWDTADTRYFIRYANNFDTRLYVATHNILPQDVPGGQMDYEMDVRRGRTSVDIGAYVGDEYGWDTGFSSTGDWWMGAVRPITNGAIGWGSNQKPAEAPASAGPPSTADRQMLLRQQMCSIKVVYSSSGPCYLLVYTPLYTSGNFGNVGSDFTISINGFVGNQNNRAADASFQGSFQSADMRFREQRWNTFNSNFDTRWDLLNGQTIPFTLYYPS